MGKTTNLFLALMLSFGTFTALRITALPKPEDGNNFSSWVFVCEITGDQIPPNWRCHSLSMKMSAAWCVLLGTPAKASLNQGANTLASYDAFFYFAVCIALIFVADNPIVPMLGTFASILTSSPGYFLPYLLPWDLPTMAAWIFIFAIYTKVKGNGWLYMAAAIAILGLLKETILVTALFLIGAPWNWPKRITAIVLTVVASQAANWLLFGAPPDWMFSASGADTINSWNPPMLMPWLLYKRRDWPLAAVCGVFIVLQALNNLACGVYNENRDWLELAPIGWTLISERRSAQPDTAQKRNKPSRHFSFTR